jgi:hypothetical protein
MKNTKTAVVPRVVIDAKIIEAITYNIVATAQIQPSMSELADVSLRLPSSDLLLMKNTKMAAVPRVVIDAMIIEAIPYNITAMAQIQPSILEPADVSLRLPSSDPLLMKNTKMVAVPRVVVKPHIQPSSMSEFADGADDHPSAACRPGPSSASLHGRVRRRKLG